MNHRRLSRVIKRHYAERLPVLTYGATGIGKSDLVRQVAQEIAKEKGLRYSEDWKDINKKDTFCLLDIRASNLDRTDIAGYPVPNHETKTMHYYGFEGFPREGQGIIFFDEMNLAPASVQKALYALILDRHLHNYEVPEGYLVVGAGNRFEDRADVTGVPAPLELRFSIFTLDVPSIDDWTEWALAHDIDARVLMFLKRFPDRLFRFSAEIEQSGQPVPREWARLSKLIRGVDEGDFDFVYDLALGCVGEAVGNEFTAFLKLSEDIDLEAIFWKDVPLPQSIDLAYSVMAGLVNIFKQNPEKNFSQAMKLVKKFEKYSPEFAVLWVRFVKGSLDEKTAMKLFLKEEQSQKFLERYYPYLIVPKEA